MSRESIEWLNANTRIGFTDKRGKAWHYREGSTNHFTGAVPITELTGDGGLFNWEPIAMDRGCQCGCGEVSREILRSDNRHRMGTFTAGYEPHSYKTWLVDYVSTILDDTLSIGSAGLLRAGAQAWVSVEVPDNITTPEGVVFRPNLLAVTSFDGSLATTYKRVVTNVVCDNTMAAGLKETGQTFKAKHTRNSQGVMKIAQARDALAIVHTIADDFMAEVKALCEVKVTDADWQRFIDAHVSLIDKKTGEEMKGAGRTKAENKRDQLTMMWKTDERCEPWKGTAFGVLQTLNTYEHHFSVFKGGNRTATNMGNALTGKTADKDGEAIATLNRVLAAV
jgi:phage/plasmid-like protein (TIGR03299 family)